MFFISWFDKDKYIYKMSLDLFNKEILIIKL